MSDIFETDIDNENENLSNLEDSDVSQVIESDIVVDYPLYHIKLEYSNETLYARTPGNYALKAGEYVITPTRYGKDMASVANAVVMEVAGRLSHPQLSTCGSFVDNERGEYAFPLHHYLHFACKRFFR